jgi:Glycosyl hydrolases family 2, TIM barrel domain/Glycosyl hydrolases family 2/Glycosyl hydrolases family 2, sugar binding domain
LSVISPDQKLILRARKRLRIFIGVNVFWLLLALFQATAGTALAGSVPQNTVWPRPTILPVPFSVEGVKQPVISLNGNWKINADPSGEYWSNSVDPVSWNDVRVPSQADMQGIPIVRDHPYAYKTKIKIPSDFASNRIFLRFEGVTGTARVWLNGTEACGHYGGFTVWTCDVTDKVVAGQDAWLTLGVLEPQPRASTESYGGGIIRDVKLVAVPQQYLSRFAIETDFNRDFQHATLRVWVRLSNALQPTEVRFALKDWAGQSVPLRPDHVFLTGKKPESLSEIPISSPLKWTAEHPNLYTLEVSLLSNGQTTETLARKVGFRKVEVSGRKLLVNGHEVKLRGVGQFESNPFLGLTVAPGEAENDVKLYKEANLNFVRAATYPATEEFLDACDRYGLYVEEDAPVNFTRGAESDPKLSPIFLSQTAEMVETDQNHPSIIMWDLANESNYGVNIRKEHDYIKEEDPSRPLVFSWSHEVPPDEPLPYDIYSYHYPKPTDDLGSPGVAVFNSPATRVVPATMPVLADEFAHPACYDYDELKRDPNVRNFWGESIKRFWDAMVPTEGSAGGAIWAGIDDTISRTRVYGWGLFDIWRREKPEFWLAKKAFSPIRIQDQPIHAPDAGKNLEVPVANWYDDTNLNEITVKWHAGADSGSLTAPDVTPHAKGSIRLPRRRWQPGEVLNLKFLSPSNELVDEYNLAVDPVFPAFPGPQGPVPKVEESREQITVTGSSFALVFSKHTGLLVRGTYKETDLLVGGPSLNLLGAELEPWSLSALHAKTDGVEAVIEISGTYGPIQVGFEVHIDGLGLITTHYVIETFPLNPPPKHEIPWNITNAGGFEEVGVSYVLASDIDTLTWSRKGLWSAYPEDHIGRNRGTAHRSGKGSSGAPGVRPPWSWAEDEKDFSLFGPGDTGGRGSNDFRSTKENIYYAAAIASRIGVGVRVESDATDAVRLEVLGSEASGRVRLFVSNVWNYRNLGNGNYMKTPVMVTAGYSNKVRMRLTDKSNN